MADDAMESCDLQIDLSRLQLVDNYALACSGCDLQIDLSRLQCGV